jgi:membrane-associated phospholipid phosphatase
MKNVPGIGLFRLAGTLESGSCADEGRTDSMTAVVALGRRFLPRGWKDFGRQLAIWFGFLIVYQVARGLAGHDRTLAIAHGHWVINTEDRIGDLVEISAQKVAASSQWLEFAVSWTYWMSEFTVLGFALLWVYLRRNEHFRRFRNWVLLAGVIGLIGYVVYPTAPPRMFPGAGFVDTLAQFASLNHGSGVIELASNQYAAMPSLHAADSLIVGITLAYIVRHWWAKVLWLLWPAWVCFSVMATANHFWLDCLAGAFVAVLAGSIIHRRRLVAFVMRRPYGTTGEPVAS